MKAKFRFWDSFNGVYFYSDKYDKLSEFFRLYELSLSGDNNPILEQFVGLKDANKVDVYQGSIVFVDGYEANKLVVFGNQMCSFRIQSHVKHESGEYITYGFEETESHEIEVIGTFHENPELLKRQEVKLK